MRKRNSKKEPEYTIQHHHKSYWNTCKDYKIPLFQEIHGYEHVQQGCEIISDNSDKNVINNGKGDHPVELPIDNISWLRLNPGLGD